MLSQASNGPIREATLVVIGRVERENVAHKLEIQCRVCAKLDVSSFRTNKRKHDEIVADSRHRPGDVFPFASRLRPRSTGRAP